MKIFVRVMGRTTTLNVENYETIFSVKRKLKEKEGFDSKWKLRMIYSGLLLKDGHTLADYNIFKESTLDLQLFMDIPNSHSNLLAAGTEITQGKPEQAPLSTPQPKTPSPATQTTPNTNRNTRSIINGEYIQGSATCADRQPMTNTTYESKLKDFAHYQAKAASILSDLMPEFQTRPSSELEDLKRKMASKERELEATISKLKHKHASCESQIIAFKAEDKKTKQELTVAHSKEKKQEATISRLTHKIKVFSGQCASYENQIVALEAQDNKTKQELMVACSKEKEQVATISRLTHKVKVFSGQCASYESQVLALEAEIKRTRAAAYAEGLKVGKAKQLESVEFLHHLTDASMQYFDYGFDSCQNQAEQQGFVGQLNKDSALKDAPDLKGWETK